MENECARKSSFQRQCMIVSVIAAKAGIQQSIKECTGSPVFIDPIY